MAVAAWLDPQERDTSLGGLCGRAGIVIEHRHQALGDARATAELWLRLLARAGARGVADLAELTRRSRIREQMEDSATLF
jgi:DNA polymerase III epsilon subunit-like protein